MSDEAIPPPEWVRRTIASMGRDSSDEATRAAILIRSIEREHAPVPIVSRPKVGVLAMEFRRDGATVFGIHIHRYGPIEIDGMMADGRPIDAFVEIDLPTAISTVRGLINHCYHEEYDGWEP